MCVIVIYFGHICWSMNTDVNVQPKHVGCKTETNYSAILFVNVVNMFGPFISAFHIDICNEILH